MTALWLIDVTSGFAQADFLEVSLKKSALTSRSKNLSALTKFKNSLETYLSKLSTLIFEQIMVCLTLRQLFMPYTKTTFLPIDKFYTIPKIQNGSALS